jgi:hypothetical protein
MTVHRLIRWIIEPTYATIIRCIFLELYQSQHVSSIIMHIIRRTRTRLVKTSCEDTTAPHNHSQHNQASSHEVLTSLVLVLLMMGIMMLETCWDWYNSRNIHLIIVVSVGSIIQFLFSCLCLVFGYIRYFLCNLLKQTSTFSPYNVYICFLVCISEQPHSVIGSYNRDGKCFLRGTLNKTDYIS